MATFEELIDRTNLIVQDSSLYTELGNFINQGVYEIAGGMQSALGDWITPPLPKLFSIDTVNTSTIVAYVDMPETFHRGLQLVASENGRAIDIEHSLVDFIDTYPLLNKIGNISTVIEHGKKLYYQGIPTISEELTLHFYRKPVLMVNDDDVPDGIPEHLQMNLLSYYAAWKAFTFIEDGIEAESINVKRYMDLFYSNLKTLELNIPDYTRSLYLR